MARKVKGADGNPIQPEIVQMEATFLVKVKVDLATVNAYGEVRTDLLAELTSAISSAVAEDMPYGIDSREDTDLVQEVLDVSVVPVDAR
jgi:hypothetical protein